ncbi:hypothetical protein D1164_10330 [Mariniphaga sediminis]|uniref:Uncharacterized protein n=1 Tax=Mariniphaga sediminis TaxID=1628158 RepID=A0A399D213_9BACT|nr:hypothetical protein [Mariniphaga sediminis]RIH65506.1 hypothetical protein D1164_10330 [Mariniphaga sediminis]
MKLRIVLILWVLFFAFSCIEKDNETYVTPLKEINACGNEDPLNSLEWLNARVLSESNPRDSEYVKSVWIKEYKGNDIIVIDFGGEVSECLTFDCLGNRVVVNSQSFLESLSENELVYKSANKM